MAEEKKGKEKAGKQRRPSALKRDIQSEKRRIRNKSFKAKVHTTLRDFQNSLSAGNAKEKLDEVFSLMDKGVKIGVFKINKASRVKSRMQALISKS